MSDELPIYQILKNRIDSKEIELHGEPVERH